MRLSVDDARLSDLSIGGWLGIGLAALGVVIAANSVGEWVLYGADPVVGIVGGGFVALFGAALAHDNATPEADGVCEMCGVRATTHSNRDSADEVILVRGSGKPRRATLGPLSVVLQTRDAEYLYCSGECADEHERVHVGETDTQPAATSEVTQRVE